jgi:hypothetical protein
LPIFQRGQPAKRQAQGHRCREKEFRKRKGMKWKEKEERGSTSGSVRKRGAVAGKSTHSGHLSSKKKELVVMARQRLSSGIMVGCWQRLCEVVSFFCFCFVRFSL